MPSSITIALAADIGYEAQVVTLIKSLCYHHSRLKIYLFHKTFPDEWFDCLNKWLKPLQSEIISVLVLQEFEEYKTISHINETTFYRFLIPDLPEERVIYLDCDMVVNGDLSALIHTPFGGLPLLAVEDFVLNNISHYYPEYPDLKPYFNAGMLVFNIPVWQEHQWLDKLLEQLLTAADRMFYADQDVLNSLLCKSWKAVSYIYNFQTDAILELESRSQQEIIENKGWLKNGEPLIIHYTSPMKPWKITGNMLFREKYWFYYNLSWQEIMERHR